MAFAGDDLHRLVIWQQKKLHIVQLAGDARFLNSRRCFEQDHQERKSQRSTHCLVGRPEKIVQFFPSPAYVVIVPNFVRKCQTCSQRPFCLCVFVFRPVLFACIIEINLEIPLRFPSTGKLQPNKLLRTTKKENKN